MSLHLQLPLEQTTQGQSREVSLEQDNGGSIAGRSVCRDLVSHCSSLEMAATHTVSMSIAKQHGEVSRNIFKLDMHVSGPLVQEH